MSCAISPLCRGLLWAGLLFGSFPVLADYHVVGQHNKTLVMAGEPVQTLQIKVGDAIRFENQDPFFHNIFSMSELKPFDLGSFPQGEWREVVFDQPGMAEIECAIHPRMFMQLEVIE